MQNGNRRITSTPVWHLNPRCNLRNHLVQSVENAATEEHRIWPIFHIVHLCCLPKDQAQCLPDDGDKTRDCHDICSPNTNAQQRPWGLPAWVIRTRCVAREAQKPEHFPKIFDNRIKPNKTPAHPVIFLDKQPEAPSTCQPSARKPDSHQTHLLHTSLPSKVELPPTCHPQAGRNTSQHQISKTARAGPHVHNPCFLWFVPRTGRGGAHTLSLMSLSWSPEAPLSNLKHLSAPADLQRPGIGSYIKYVSCRCRMRTMKVG